MALADVFERIAGPDAPVEFRAYDGSIAGSPDAPIRITIRSPVAVSYLAQAPGTLGLARAYVSGHLDVDGDMYTALRRMIQAQEGSLSTGEKVQLLRDLGGPRLLLPRIPPPPQEVRISRRWLVGKLELRNDVPTPACEINDGEDFVPTPAPYLFSQHFSAIAAAGPHPTIDG